MTRDTSSSKGRTSGKKRGSKYSHLRRKLTLKRKCSPAQFNIIENEPEGIHHDEDDSHENLVARVRTSPRLTPIKQETRNKVPITMVKEKPLFQRASPMKLVRLYPKLSDEQKTLIQTVGCGGLLEIKISKLHPALCQFLMESFDPVSCQLVFPGRGAIPVTENSIQCVMGVPKGRLDVNYTRDKKATAFMQEQMGWASRKQPTVASLEEKLEKMRPANSKFLRLFMTYAMSSVLAPTTGIRISPRVYPSMVNIKEAKNLNIAKFLINILCKRLSSEGEKEQVSPCMLYLMVKYLDSLQLEDMEVSSEGTRVSVWTNAMVKKAIKQDTKENGEFGAAPLKPKFTEVQESSEDRTLTYDSSDESKHATYQSDINDNTYIPAPDDPDESMSFEGDSKNADDFPDSTPVAPASENSGSFKQDYNYEEEEYVPMSHSILFPDKTRMLKFIEKNAPKDRTQQDTERYMEATEYACHGFESSLQMLVRSLATSTRNDSQQGTNIPSFAQGIEDSPPKKETMKQELKKNMQGQDLAKDFNVNANAEVQNHDGSPKVADVTEASEHGQDVSVTNGNKEQSSTERDEGCQDNDKIGPETDMRTTAQNTETTLGGELETNTADGLEPENKQDQLMSDQDVTAGPSVHSYASEGEESSQSDCSMKREEKRQLFLKMVGSSPVNKVKIPLFEPPEFLDIEENAKPSLKEIARAEKPMDCPMDGLINLLDGTLPEACQKLKAEMEPKPIPRKRKHVTFQDDQEKKIKGQIQEAPSPSGGRCRKRSTANCQAPSSVILVPSVSPRRSPRNHSRLNVTTNVINLDSDEQKSAHTAARPTVSPLADNDPMSRRLEFDGSETDRTHPLNYEGPDAPSFDLDTPPDACDQHKEKEQPGCSKTGADPSADSITPVPHEYNKRIVKQGKFARSPFVNPETEKSYKVSSSVDTLYSMVCEHAGRRGSQDPNNDKTVIDLDNTFCNLGDLAKSVAPRSRMVNIVAEIGIEITKRENLDPKKVIMPLRISNYLIRGRFPLKEVERCFENSPANRLDHKDIICFPTLEHFKVLKNEYETEQQKKEKIGHYWLVNLNIKAQRFEIMDSIARNGEALLMESCHYLVAGIKKCWSTHYPKSKVQIHNWPIEMIETPQQDNTFDCGFFMMKSLEGCSNRKPSTFAQKDMPNIRKLYTDKWLRFNDNVKGWQMYL